MIVFLTHNHWLVFFSLLLFGRMLCKDSYVYCKSRNRNKFWPTKEKERGKFKSLVQPTESKKKIIKLEAGQGCSWAVPGCLGVRVHSPVFPQFAAITTTSTIMFLHSSFRFTEKEILSTSLICLRLGNTERPLKSQDREGTATQKGQSLWQPFQEVFHDFENKSMSGEGEFQ